MTMKLQGRDYNLTDSSNSWVVVNILAVLF